MLDFWLIRHGMTAGNRLGRYIGRTDEPLCEEGRALLRGRSFRPEPQAVYVSPLRRASETARILFPDLPLHIVEELSECDFGEFENRNYRELAGNPHYQEWVDSGGTLPFPGGESREAFRRRSIRGFEKTVNSCIRSGITEAAVVTHGGVIMNLMEEYAQTDRSFYEWHVENGGSYRVSLEEELWKAGRRSFALQDERMRGQGI